MEEARESAKIAKIYTLFKEWCALPTKGAEKGNANSELTLFPGGEGRVRYSSVLDMTWDDLDEGVFFLSLAVDYVKNNPYRPWDLMVGLDFDSGLSPVIAKQLADEATLLSMARAVVGHYDTWGDIVALCAEHLASYREDGKLISTNPVDSSIGLGVCYECLWETLNDDNIK